MTTQTSLATVVKPKLEAFMDKLGECIPSDGSLNLRFVHKLEGEEPRFGPYVGVDSAKVDVAVRLTFRDGYDAGQDGHDSVAAANDSAAAAARTFQNLNEMFLDLVPPSRDIVDRIREPLRDALKDTALN